MIASVTSVAHAQSVPASGADVVWLAPDAGAEFDPSTWQEHEIALDRPRELSATTWLTTRLQPGEVAWIRVPGDADGRAVRFAKMAADARLSVLTELSPERVAAGEFVVVAPLGPPMRLALQARSARELKQVQIWIASAHRPGYRWELWEEAAKRWASAPHTLPPAPPDEIARDLVEQLAVVADAIARAQRQDGRDRGAGVAALLSAEALLFASPSREPAFPYSRRVEYTLDIAQAAGLRHVEDQGAEVLELAAGQRVSFHMRGTGALRIDARALLGAAHTRAATPFELVLRSGDRVVALGTDPATESPTASDRPDERVSSLRRLVAPALPGDHVYTLEVRGAPARIRIFEHGRFAHVEDPLAGSEDIGGLLHEAAGAGTPGLLHDLLAAEAAFADAEPEPARRYFGRLRTGARDSALRAFALGRLAAMAQSANAARALTREALALLDGQHGEANDRLRDLIAFDGAIRALADGDASAARELGRQVPSMLVRFPEAAGRVLRGQDESGARALALLGAALRAHPLDAALRRAASREWRNATRWVQSPIEAGPASSARLTITDGGSASSCAQATAAGSSAFVALPSGAVELHVSAIDAKPPYLRRMHLIALRTDGSTALGRAELELDGEASVLPLLPAPERIAFAVDQGVHRLAGHYDHGKLLVPCALLDPQTARTLPGPIYLEQRAVELLHAGASLSAPLPEPNASAYAAIEVYPTSGPTARLRVRTGGVDLARLEVQANPQAARDPSAPGLIYPLEVPAGVARLEVVRDDDGAPLRVRILLRRQGGKEAALEPRQPAHPLTPEDLATLLGATRAITAAKGVAARASARLARAELLASFGLITAARAELGRAMPQLDGAGTLRARALLQSFEAVSLLEAPAGRGAVLLSPAANLDATTAERACIDEALGRFERVPAEGLRQLSACSGALAAYLVGHLHDLAGDRARAGAEYARAFALGAAPSIGGTAPALRGGASGGTAPALGGGASDGTAPALRGGASIAREAALRLADTDATRALALALATRAEQAGDADSARALAVARRGVQWKTVHEGAGSEQVSLPGLATALSPVSAAMIDLPWPEADVIALHPGRAVVTGFEIQTPLSLFAEAFCVRAGAVADEPERCPVTFELDGAPTPLELASAVVTDLGEHVLPAGEHRISVQLARSASDAQVFIRLTTSRAVGAGGVTSTRGTAPALRGGASLTDNRFLLSRASGTMRRALARESSPVELSLEAPATLRVDGVYAIGADVRGLDVTITRADGTIARQHHEVCHDAGQPLLPPLAARFDCHATTFVALTDSGPTQVAVKPTGASEAAFAFAVGEATPSPAESALPDKLEATSQSTAAATAPAARAELRAWPEPLGNFSRSLGTLQVEILGVYGSQADRDPRIGDRFEQTSIVYRRKLEALPIWLLGAGFLRLRDGPPSQGFELLGFARIPPIQLRWLADLRVFTQKHELDRATSAGFGTYLERSFETLPRFYLLPRIGLTLAYQSIATRPPLQVADNTPLDPTVWNSFDRRHPFSTYGQLLLWWVPFINTIVYAQARASSSPSVSELDRFTAQTGLNLVFGTTELLGTYSVTHAFAGEARSSASTRHELGAAVSQTLWITRGQRLGLRASSTVDVAGTGYVFFAGVFWEGSHGRGLDDYSTPEVNFPQQLGQGRGIPAEEQSLR